MKMKYVLLFTSVMSSTGLFAQTEIKPVKEHYTVSGGILGAANFSKLRVGDNNGFIESDGSRTGYAGGIWLNFPLGMVVSLEPQVQ